MKIKLNYEKWFVFFLPTIVILSQWFSIAGIRLSWIISFVLTVLISKNYNRLIKNILCCTFLLLTVVTPISNFLFSPNAAFNVSLYISLVTGLILALYIIQLDTEVFEKLKEGVLFSCILFGLWGVFEIYTGTYLLTEHEFFTVRLNIYGRHYPCVAFTNTNDLAQYLVILYTLTSGTLLKKSKLGFGLSLIPIVIAVYHSLSRLSMICLGLFLILVFFLELLSENKIKCITIILGFVCLIGTVVLIFDVKTGFLTNELGNILVAFSEADFVSGRTVLYENLLKAAKKLPFGGFGTSYLINDMPPHCLFLFVLCDYGWIPAILFVWMLIKIFINFWKNAKQDISIVCYCASMCMFIVMANVSSVNEQRKVIWIFLGMVMHMYIGYRQQTRIKDIKIGEV